MEKLAILRIMQSNRTGVITCLLFYLLVFLFGACEINTVSAQSFNCRLAKTPDELVICSDSSLSSLDERMAQAYSDARNRVSPHARSQLNDEQRNWLLNRRACSSHVPCLRAAYEQRINELSSNNKKLGKIVVGGHSNAPKGINAFIDTAQSEKIPAVIYPRDALTRYPWLVKSQTELTYAECQTVMKHDFNYWWANGKCHMKYIRYAAAIAIRDSVAIEAPDSVMRKGELLSPTQYRPDEESYCEHGGYCYPAKDFKLLGSIFIGRSGDYKSGDETDNYQGLSTSCELIFADRENIIAAGKQELFKDCH